MRFILLIFALATVPFMAWAVEAPAGQVRIDATKVLRGHFVEEHSMKGSRGPMRSSGHFVVAPAHGLIWGIEKPFPTSTIITPNGAAQDIGGMAVKLPAKNIAHLYDIVGGALAGDWRGLEEDFVLTRSGDAQHWQILLTPRQGNASRLPYATITVDGSRFVENIVMTKVDESYDSLSFSDEILSPTPLTSAENAVFNKVMP